MKYMFLIRFCGTFFVCLMLTGCGRAKEENTVEPQNNAPAKEAVADVEFDFTVNENAPFVSEKYPDLTSDVLTHARLDELPEGVLMVADDIKITQQDVEDEISRAPEAIREELQKNALYILEQMASLQLIDSEAKKAGVSGRDENAIRRAFVEQIAGQSDVSDEEVRAFYDANPDMMGGSPFEKMQSVIKEHLVQEKTQEMFKKYLRETGLRISLAVDADWIAEKAKTAVDNVVDKARADGKPAFVNFGSDSCMPCRMLEPVREKIEEKYSDQLTVVHVDVSEHPILSARYGVRGIPHIIFFDADGKEVHVQSGFMSLEQIEPWLKKIGVNIE